MKLFLLSWRFLKPALGTIAGGVLGYAYYHFVGCSSGNCAITSSPYSSSLMGAFMGFYMMNSSCRSC
ncbi:MAG: hypothetical protein HXX13_15780 [Bacteroidetes bacterium]|nr:hypothetical protein [Bacteroidota bacterium]